MGKKGNKAERYHSILMEKCRFDWHEECKNIPAGKQLIEYLDYVDSMEFDSEPEYSYLKNIFECKLNDLSDDSGIEDEESPFDWVD